MRDAKRLRLLTKPARMYYEQKQTKRRMATKVHHLPAPGRETAIVSHPFVTGSEEGKEENRP